MTYTIKYTCLHNLVELYICHQHPILEYFYPIKDLWCPLLKSHLQPLATALSQSPPGICWIFHAKESACGPSGFDIPFTPFLSSTHVVAFITTLYFWDIISGSSDWRQSLCSCGSWTPNLPVSTSHPRLTMCTTPGFCHSFLLLNDIPFCENVIFCLPINPF